MPIEFVCIHLKKGFSTAWKITLTTGMRTIGLYEKMFNSISEALMKKDFSSEFADVLNKYNGSSKLKADDFSGYKPPCILGRIIFPLGISTE